MYRHGSKSLKRRLLSMMSRELIRDHFWALKDVTFDVREGETLGIVGSNGSGKSTLCMAAAQILTPDEGTVHVHGKVAPILSLNAGMTRDMTGVENIYLGGALMGYNRKEVKKWEKSILEFTELGDFIENPVRTYSSGMKARLAFSIATSVDPDVLIIDEVLGVGDTYFRQKSLARMKGLMARARAIMLVSHSAETIREMCNKALWLEHGKIQAIGEVEDVMNKYEAWQAENIARKKAADITQAPERQAGGD